MIGTMEMIGIGIVLILIYVLGKNSKKFAKNAGKNISEFGTNLKDSVDEFKTGLKEGKESIKELKNG